MRFYLVDKVTKLKVGESAEGIKCVTKSEEYLEQHFPGYPVMPGVLTIEACAQLSGYLLSKTMEMKGQYVFAILSIVEKAKFYKMATPGDQIRIKTVIEYIREDSASVIAQASVDNRKIADVKMVFAFFKVEGDSEEEKRKICMKMFSGIESKEVFFQRKVDYV